MTLKKLFKSKRDDENLRAVILLGEAQIILQEVLRDHTELLPIEIELIREYFADRLFEMYERASERAA